jgi:predicted dehydrogenase
MSAIQPYILGRGSAGKAIQKSLALLGVVHPEWETAPPIQLPRDVSWDRLNVDGARAVAFIATPHALHAEALLGAERAGFRHLVVEKPACVTLEQRESLRLLQAKVAVLHGYRLMWGPQWLRAQIDSGEWGRLVALEGRYWQSSTAQRALAPVTTSGWKNDPSLSGSHDVLLDLAPHWVDLANFLAGQPATGGNAWLSFANAESTHRDTHVHLDLAYRSGVRGLASISKTWHGAGNDLEIHVLCEGATAVWRFAAPDEVVVGRGASRATVTRPATDPRGSRQAPGHGLGWIEGYVEITAQMLRAMVGGGETHYPTLDEHLAVMDLLLRLAPSAVPR